MSPKIIMTLLAAASLGLTAPSLAQNSARSAALTIIEAGFAADGTTPRYTLEANGADLRDVLSALLRKTGKEFVIHQDVTGPISLVLKDKTLPDILSTITKITRPQVEIRFGDVITVAVAPPVMESGNAPVAAQSAPTVSSRVAAIRTSQMQSAVTQVPLLAQPVTLSIPDDRPVALRSVLLQVEGQTRIPIRLDPRVPADVGVAARFTETPLSLVLDSMARTGALKWQLRPDGTILIAPSDWLLVTVRGVPVLGNPSGVCPTCGKPVLPSWRFCPHDGTPLGQRGQRQGAPRGR